MQAEDDGVLIDRARDGDSAAFEGLVRRHDRAVLALALRLGGTREEAGDIYQETFLRAFRALPRFRGECSFRTWILRIATNVCLDGRRRAAPRRDEVPVEATAEGRMERPDIRPDGDPERALAGAEIRARIGAALAGLTPRERMVFELKHVQGERLAEVARVLETTEETVRNCLYRAHRRLREALGDLDPAGRGGRPAAGRAVMEAE